MSKYYEIVVFTAGLKDYADWIINDFDRQHYISYRLTETTRNTEMEFMSKISQSWEGILLRLLLLTTLKKTFRRNLITAYTLRDGIMILMIES